MKLMTCVCLALLCAACGGDPVTKWSCDKLKSDQALRQACMETSGCTMTMEDLKRHQQTADAIKRYCT